MSAPLIQCQDLALGYETGLAVRHLTFTVNSGDYLCLVGENGSGKSETVSGQVWDSSRNQPQPAKTVHRAGAAVF